MNYMTVTPNEYNPRNSPTVKIDLVRFATDLARQLGGCVVSDRDTERSVKISNGADELHLYADEYGQRIKVSITASDVRRTDIPNRTYDKSYSTESASINPNKRTIAAIAKDIRKRVIDASQPALANQREYARQLDVQRDGLSRCAEQLDQKLREILPLLSPYNSQNIRIKIADCATVASVSTVNPSTDARLYANGTLYLDRMPTVTLDQFVRICEILNEKDNG